MSIRTHLYQTFHISDIRSTFFSCMGFLISTVTRSTLAESLFLIRIHALLGEIDLDDAVLCTALYRFAVTVFCIHQAYSTISGSIADNKIHDEYQRHVLYLVDALQHIPRTSLLHKTSHKTHNTLTKTPDRMDSHSGGSRSRRVPTPNYHTPKPVSPDSDNVQQTTFCQTN